MLYDFPRASNSSADPDLGNLQLLLEENEFLQRLENVQK
jgi:hypothetical protein